MFAIDLTNATERVFPALAGVGRGRRRGRVGRARRRAARARRRRPSPARIARVYRIRPRDESRRRGRSARRRSSTDATIADAIAAREAGDVVVVPAGIHPVAGAAGPGRRHRAGRAGRDARRRRRARCSSSTAGCRLEGVTVTGGAAGYMMIPPTCVTTSGDGIEIRDCTLQSLQLGGGRGHRIVGNEIDGGNLWAFGCNDDHDPGEPPARASAGASAST